MNRRTRGFSTLHHFEIGDFRFTVFGVADFRICGFCNATLPLQLC